MLSRHARHHAQKVSCPTQAKYIPWTWESEAQCWTLRPGSWLLATDKDTYLFLEGRCRHKTPRPLYASPPACEIGKCVKLKNAPPRVPVS